MRSALLPASIEPRAGSQPSIAAGVLVAIASRSALLMLTPARSAASRATFSSPRRLLLPDGDQSEPTATGTPAARASPTAAVPPYSSRFDSGDHTIDPPCAA